MSFTPGCTITYEGSEGYWSVSLMLTLLLDIYNSMQVDPKMSNELSWRCRDESSNEASSNEGSSNSWSSNDEASGVSSNKLAFKFFVTRFDFFRNYINLSVTWLVGLGSSGTVNLKVFINCFCLNLWEVRFDFWELFLALSLRLKRKMSYWSWQPAAGVRVLRT